MRKIISVITLVIIASTSQGQQKPSKEETIDFVNRMVSSVSGKKHAWQVISSATFSGKSYKYSANVGQSGKTEVEYSSIKWEDMDQLFNPTPEENGVVQFAVTFKTQMKYFRDFNLNDETDKDEFTSQLVLIVPVDKYESIKKALLRLNEIAKEENKDPFAN